MFLDDVRSKYKSFLHAKEERESYLRQGINLLELTFLTRRFQASDPRYKLFAFIGPANDVRSSDWRIVPNYDLPTAEVYHRFALGTSPAHKFRDLSLGINRDISPNTNLEMLPSWVALDMGLTKDGRK